MRWLVTVALLAVACVTVAPTSATFEQSTGATTSVTTNTTFAPVDDVAPQILGAVGLGATLTADRGSWSNSNETITYAYAWQVCTVLLGCSSLGAGPTAVVPLTLGLGDSIASIKLTVTASNSFGATPVTVSKT